MPPPSAPLLEARHRSWDWVRTACDQASRKQRLFAACEVMCSIYARTEHGAALVDGRDPAVVLRDAGRDMETQVRTLGALGGETYLSWSAFLLSGVRAHFGEQAGPQHVDVLR